MYTVQNTAYNTNELIAPPGWYGENENLPRLSAVETALIVLYNKK